MKIYETIHEAYLGTLADVIDNPDYVCAPRGLKIREKTDYQFRVLKPVAEPIVTLDTDRNKVIVDYTNKEVELYNSCSNRVEDFAKASKFWKKIANKDGTINSAYGYLIWKNKSHGDHIRELELYGPNVTKDECYRTPWEWCKMALANDKDTRQAIIKFSLPEHHFKGNKDYVCTMHANFLIRDDKLNLSVVMRSNDLVKGIAYDIVFFVSLIDKMIVELKDIYPELTKGHYTHTVHSMHAYEKDLNTINKMLGRK